MVTEKSNEKIDLLVSFDTTGSMYPVLSQVRREVDSFIKSIFKEYTDLRLGIIAHGDYCDKDNPYTIIYRELSRDEKVLCNFVNTVERTYGGDADECYELVLNFAHSDKMGWREDANKIFIMIGDASPHAPNYKDNKDRLDWVTEADELRKLGVKVFAVHALAGMRSSSKAFYKRVASDTNGVYLTLGQFSEILDLIKATVYNQSGEERISEFITIIKDSGRFTKSLDNNIKRLRGEDVADDDYRCATSYVRGKTSRKIGSSDVVIKEMGEMVPVIPGRFQVMTVDDNCDIKGFVTKNGIEFKKGRGFYELTKAETVQQYKEIIIQDRETGEMFNGSQVREKLGLQPQSEKGGVNEKLHASDAKIYRVFVQSTSINRKLIAGTTFLYEIPDMEDTGTVITLDVSEDKKKEAVKKKAEKAEKVVVKKEDKPKKKKEIIESSEEKIEDIKVTKSKEEKTYVKDIKFDSIGDITTVITVTSDEAKKLETKDRCNKCKNKSETEESIIEKVTNSDEAESKCKKKRDKKCECKCHEKEADSNNIRFDSEIINKVVENLSLAVKSLNEVIDLLKTGKK